MAFVGARLRELRKARKLTQDQLAEMAGIKRTDISSIENDKKPLGPVRASKFARALEISVLELLPAAEPDERGLVLEDRLTKLVAEVERLAADSRLLGRRVSALERRVLPESDQARRRTNR